jgi:UDP-3-O-[3-hydroxymyristoyl] glucosamine N-acyltransferase
MHSLRLLTLCWTHGLATDWDSISDPRYHVESSNEPEGECEDMQLTLHEIAQRVGAEIAGDPQVKIRGVNALEAARAGEVTFAEHERLAKDVRACSASAVVVPESFPHVPGKNLLRVVQPRPAFVRIMRLFQEQMRFPAGVHPRAVVSSSARLGKGVSVRECAVIREKVRIGRGSVVESGVHIGRGVEMGEDCWIGPNVVLMHGVRLGARVSIHGGSVIGGDGFGYVWAGDRYLKVPQLGIVEIEDDVEIGCNVCIDRATFGATHIRRGTKIDNQVQIGHNNSIGEDTIIVSQVGLSGSVTVGKHVTMAGQVGVTDHVRIGDGATVGGAAAVTKSVDAGSVVWGYPARPMQRILRELAAVSQLPKLVRKFRDFSNRVDALEKRLVSLERAGPDSGSGE